MNRLRWKWTGRLLGILALAALLLTAVTVAFAGGPGGGDGGGPPGRGVEKDRFGFDDLDEAPWAKGYMTLMAAKGIFKGRGKGKMAPKAAVNRAEVIAAVVRLRLLAEGVAALDGQEGSVTADVYARRAYEEARGFAFRFTDSALLTRGAARWAAPYVYVAIQEGILENRGRLQPMKAAERAWVAEVLVRALEGLVAVDPASGRVSFTDTGNLPPGVVAYIEKAVAAGLFNGYPDGSFRPHGPLTRAELMALMARADEDHGLTESREVYRGVITAIATSGDSAVTAITVAPRRGDDDGEDEDGDGERSVADAAYGSLTFQLDRDTLVYVKGRPGEASMLQVGDRVHVKAFEDEGGNLVAAVIWATFEPWELQGVVTEAGGDRITVEVTEVGEPDEDGPPPQVAEGQTATFDVAGYATLKYRGKTQAYDPAGVRPGDQVELKLHGNLVIQVEIEERPESEITGEVTAVDAAARSVTVKVLENDEEHPVAVGPDGLFTFTVAEDAEIRRNGDAATLADIAVGDVLEAKLEGGAATKVVIEESGNGERGERA